jgi:hypothetical protein
LTSESTVRRAIAALRSGRSVTIDGLTVIAVETVPAEMLELIDANAKAVADQWRTGRRVIARQHA